MNRCRRFLAGVMRGLAVRGIGSWLPDLPGTGESLRTIEAVGWSDWECAVSAAAGAVEHDGRLVVAAFRGGALLDAVDAKAHWRLSPLEGRGVLRDLVRARQLADREDSGIADPIEPRLVRETIELAGYRVGPALSDGLARAFPDSVAPLRVARLEGDAGDADVRLDGPPLWRRAEPGDAPALADRVADDIALWAERCGVI